MKLIHSKFPDNTAVISYFGTNEKPVNFPSYIKHIRLFIDDLREDEIDDPDNFHIDDFRRIARFVFNCKEKDLDIICQCEEGISRSAGTAAAILEYFENNENLIFKDDKYIPNLVFYNNLYRCLKEIQEK